MDINTNSILAILTKGKLTLKGEFLWGSNYTFLVALEYKGETAQGVYKPVRGERPLWDFPPASLARREVAAYLVSQFLGWGLVPPTIYRKNAPLGAGSIQLFVEHNPKYHYFNFSLTDIQRLRPAVVFDLLINNADRKGSHVIIDPNNHLWLIDHGVCFHVDEKLRTVLWDFVGEVIPEELCLDLEKLENAVEPKENQPSSYFLELAPFLSRGEIVALGRRANQIRSLGIFPAPDPSRRPFPWPQI
jgi:hypothetical protein